MYTTGRKHFDALIDFSSNIGDVKNKSNQELLELVNLYFDKYKSPYPYFMITADARVFEKQKTKESEKIIEILGKLRLYGRSRFNKTHELINPLFLEIAKRFSLTVKELKFLTPSEIKLLLQGRQLDVVNLMKQREKCFFTHTHGHFVLHENSSLIIDDRIESEEIKGQGTFPAVYKGRVRLIKDQDDMQNVEDGDVIVLQMTTTDIIAKGLKKVGAIITDEGGLTCHAAVVSREFKIPALIGTGNATKILKDGDMVEVDTEKGMVRRK
jgi:phosphohistidine swiveling domain-containing protein